MLFLTTFLNIYNSLNLVNDMSIKTLPLKLKFFEVRHYTIYFYPIMDGCPCLRNRICRGIEKIIIINLYSNVDSDSIY